MNILVCVKQVPNAQEISLHPETNTLLREGAENILNPCDGFALEAATRLKDKDKHIQIHVLCMGPPQAEAVLRECLAISADAAYLATDECFAGSDTLATSHILSASIRKIEATEGISFDMVFCGKQSMDSGTGQVGPQLAEALGFAQLSCVLTCELKGDELHVLREAEDGRESVGIKLPCLLSFTKPNFGLRLASVKRKFAAKKMEIKTLSADDLEGLDRTKIGLTGSATKARATLAPHPPKKRVGIVFKEEPLEESVEKLAQWLIDNEVVVNVA